MAIQTQALQREFVYSSMTLPDPGPNLSPAAVRDIYAASFPEITTAEIEGPTRKGDKLVFEFRRAAGTKG